jgi:transposase
MDEIAKLKNITILRLSLYHYELNSIETIWSHVKNYVATRNVTFKFGDVENISYVKLKILGFI